MYSERSRSHPLRTLFVLTMLLLVVAGAVGYARGWIKFTTTAETATIEVKTGEVKRAASDLQKRGEAIIEKASEAVKEARQPVQDRPTDAKRGDPVSP